MYRFRFYLQRALFWITLVAFLAVIVAPIYWMVNTSLKTPREVISPIPTFFPQTPTLQNYGNVFSAGIWRNFYNTVVVAVSSTASSIVLAFLASYALVRFRFPLKINRLFLIWVLVVRILPPIVLAVPLFTVFNQVRLINTLAGLIIAFQIYTLPYSIWIIYGFLKSLPLEFEEAAMIDGASPGRVLVSIVAPLVRTGVIATSIFSLILAWNEFLFALLFVRTPRLLTLPVVISRYIGEYSTQWGELMAIGLMASLPILVFSNLVYRQLTQGFSMSLK
ncbi:carbohydrate ABC transporter membrane protein 2, CUT1 family [Alkalispirochaeta americana]|uniref:Carbohydrate ABC transporter membrane protein 2, CUT1 family n=2 Tax=Alkalispirochaeta americana TaxID=159291 RepID=A0A1N6R8T5_9SPIO|nr:carbohydrate ABC transporter membrane protein 2, CUT1 family [Alkalispirochaeta americana]